MTGRGSKTLVWRDWDGWRYPTQENKGKEELSWGGCHLRQKTCTGETYPGNVSPAPNNIRFVPYISHEEVDKRWNIYLTDCYERPIFLVRTTGEGGRQIFQFFATKYKKNTAWWSVLTRPRTSKCFPRTGISLLLLLSNWTRMFSNSKATSINTPIITKSDVCKPSGPPSRTRCWILLIHIVFIGVMLVAFTCNFMSNQREPSRRSGRF
jgi:hypothetical protein